MSVERGACKVVESVGLSRPVLVGWLLGAAKSDLVA